MSTYPLTQAQYNISTIGLQEDITLTNIENLIDVAKITQILKIQHDNDNEILLDIASSVLEQVENFTSKFIMPRQIDVLVSNFSGNLIRLKIEPISSIIYITADEEEVGDYHLDNGKILFKETLNSKELNIRYIAGYKNPEEVPKFLIQNMILHIINIYENPRESQDLVKLYGSFLKSKI